MPYLILIFLIFLASCSRESDAVKNTVKLHKSQLENLLVVGNSIRAADKKFADTSYYIVNENWAKNIFPDEYSKFLFDFKKKYTKSSIVDCDNYTALAESFASFSYPIDISNNDEGITVGIFHYTTDRNTGHAVNLIVVQEDNKPKLLFFEPQTAKFVKLSETEIKSCDFFEFK
jgi:hypothetical protein